MNEGGEGSLARKEVAGIASAYLAAGLIAGGISGYLIGHKTATPTLSGPCGVACAGQEASERCAGDDVRTPHTVFPEGTGRFTLTAGEVKVGVQIREANPYVCDRDYWVLAFPNPSTKGRWETWLQIDGRDNLKIAHQISELNQPTTELISRVGHADRPGLKVEACIQEDTPDGTPMGAPVCNGTTSA